jgi:hypothetical protein
MHVLSQVCYRTNSRLFALESYNILLEPLLPVILREAARDAAFYDTLP